MMVPRVEKLQPEYLAYASQSSSSSEPASDFNIAVAADWGCSSDAQKTADNIENKSPELVLAPGDFSYEERSGDCWIGIISPFASKTKIAIGNHDDKETGSKKVKDQYMDYFKLAQSFYSFNYKNVHVLVMDTQLPYEEGSEQYNYVIDDLQKASTDPNTDWIFVMFHKPMYSSPSSHAPEESLRRIYHPLFDKYGVDLVIQAHNHIYERTYPLKFNSDNPSSPIADITNYINNSYYRNPSDPIFVIVGTGGQSLYHIEEKLPYVVYSSNKNYGFLNIDIINNKTLSATFYSNDGSSDDSIKDEFNVSKEKQERPTAALSSSPQPSLSPQPKEGIIDIQKAKQFVKSQYDANVKLVKEAPTLDRFWLWPDNVLAVKVLSGFDNLLARTINQTVNQYESQHNLVMRNPIADLVDDPQDFSVKGSRVLQVSNSSSNPDIRYADYTIETTELTCNQYGDIAFLNSIHLFEQGKTDEAKTCYEEGAAQFDGIGINDAPRQISYGAYDIYKMVLWKIAQNITGFTTNAPPQPYTDNLIKRAQDSNGGIKSEYTSIDSISGLTNIQTTSLAILAYDKAQPTLSTVRDR